MKKLEKIMESHILPLSTGNFLSNNITFNSFFIEKNIYSTDACYLCTWIFLFTFVTNPSISSVVARCVATIVDINNETNMKTTKSAPSPLYSMLEVMPSIWSQNLSTSSTLNKGGRGYTYYVLLLDVVVSTG